MTVIDQSQHLLQINTSVWKIQEVFQLPIDDRD